MPSMAFSCEGMAAIRSSAVASSPRMASRWSVSVAMCESSEASIERLTAASSRSISPITGFCSEPFASRRLRVSMASLYRSICAATVSLATDAAIGISSPACAGSRR